MALWLHREREIACHGINLFYEARDQSRNGQVGVLDVVSNRVNNKSFPNTFCEVIKQRKAFSWYLFLEKHLPKNELMWESFSREMFKDDFIELTALNISMSLARWHYLIDPEDTTEGSLYYMTYSGLNNISSQIISYEISMISEDHLFFYKINWR